MEKELKILLLEDDTEDVDIIEHILKQSMQGLKFYYAPDKAVYIHALEHLKPDCILADNSVTGMNAAQALALAKEKIPGVPFIMVTGTVPEKYAIEMLTSGADDYLLKDRLERLPQAIESAVNKRDSLQRLQENEHTYRTLIERVSDGFLAIDAGWNFVYVNKKAEQMFGRTAGTLLGKNVWSEFPDAAEEPFFKVCQTAMATQENGYVKAYSAVMSRWVVGYIYPSRTGLSVYFGDITEQKKAEARVKESEEKYRELVERITDGFIALDENFNYTYVNRKTGKIVHRDPEELIGKNVWEEFPLAVGSETYHCFLKAMEEQTYQCCTDYYAPLDFWQENHVYPSPKGLSVFIRDISAHRRAELEREKDHKNLLALINNTRDMIWSVDSELRLITCNEAFTKFVVGLSGKRLFPGDIVVTENFEESLQQNYLLYYTRALTGEIFTITEHFTGAEELWSEISFYPILSGEKVVGTACFARDITAAKMAERSMKAMEKEMMHQQIQEQKKISRAIIRAQEQERNRIGQELHDNVNQILVATKMFLVNASKTEAAKAAVKYPIELIDNSIEEIRSLSSTQVTPIKNIHLQEMLEGQLDKVRSVSDSSLRFDFSVDEKALDDELKLNLYRVVQEHLNNVVKYADAQNISVAVTMTGQSIVLHIADDGKGFDLQSKRKGIGISNMINRIESFNGKLSIDTAPGKGCVLDILIPL